MALDLPIVASLLRSIRPGGFFSNYHAEIDDKGFYRGCDQYHWILNRYVRGVIEVPVVHCTYLARSGVLGELTHEDGRGGYDYVVFSDSARWARIPQYRDNRQLYGYLTFGEGNAQCVPDGIERARSLIEHTPCG